MQSLGPLRCGFASSSRDACTMASGGISASQFGVRGQSGFTIRRQRVVRRHNSASGGNSASCRNSASGDNSASLRNPASDEAASQCGVTNNNAASPIRLRLQVVSTPPAPGCPEYIYICTLLYIHKYVCAHIRIHVQKHSLQFGAEYPAKASSRCLWA